MSPSPRSGDAPNFLPLPEGLGTSSAWLINAGGVWHKPGVGSDLSFFFFFYVLCASREGRAGANPKHCFPGRSVGEHRDHFRRPFVRFCFFSPLPKSSEMRVARLELSLSLSPSLESEWKVQIRLPVSRPFGAWRQLHLRKTWHFH